MKVAAMLLATVVVLATVVYGLGTWMVIGFWCDEYPNPDCHRPGSTVALLIVAAVAAFASAVWLMSAIGHGGRLHVGVALIAHAGLSFGLLGYWITVSEHADGQLIIGWTVVEAVAFGAVILSVIHGTTPASRPPDE